MKRTAVLLGVAVLVLGPATAMAQWSDGFEAYADQQLLHNVGGWTGWDDAEGASGTATTAQAHSGEMSILAGPAADAIHPFDGEFTSGQWTMSAWMLMFEQDHTADTYFIVNNAYAHGGPYTWTIEMQFDVATGTVLDDFRDDTPLPIAYGEWAEIVIDFDLDNDMQTTYYNGQQLSTGAMTRQSGDPLAIANIDLFSTGATAYYDDFNIVPEPTSALLMLLGAGAFLRRRR
jgi:hypothetical protein